MQIYDFLQRPSLLVTTPFIILDFGKYIDLIYATEPKLDSSRWWVFIVH